MKFHKAFGTGALLLTRLSIQRRGPSGKLKTYLRKIAMGTGLRHRPPKFGDTCSFIGFFSEKTAKVMLGCEVVGAKSFLWQPMALWSDAPVTSGHGPLPPPY